MKSVLSLVISVFLFNTMLLQAKEINASSFGLKEGEDGTFALVQAVQFCKENKIDKLIIPKGTYHLSPGKAYGHFCAVSNNDNGMKRTAFPVIGMNGFEIEGNGSLFICHGQIVPFIIEESSRITVKNLSVDWTGNFHGEGVILSADEREKTFDVAFPEGGYTIENGELLIRSEGGEWGIGPNLFFDPVTKGTVYDVSAYKLDPWNPKVNLKYQAKELAPGKVRIYNQVSKLPEKGWVWVLKPRDGDKDRLTPVIRIFKSKDVYFDQCNIYHAGAMALIAERSETISMSHFNVMLSPDRPRYVSSTADATHFVNCKGTITFTDCLFENMLDDATNVHGIYTTIEELVDDNSVLVKLGHIEQYGFCFAEKGDTLQLIDRQTLQPYEKPLCVKDVSVLNEERLIITFTQPVKAILKSKSALENITWNSAVDMKRCTVRNNRARSILLSTPRNVLVEDCSFSSMMAGIAIAGDANFWYESGAVNSIIIRRNKFVNCCTSGQNQAAIVVEPNILDKEKSVCFHRNITIEDNIIETFDIPFVNAVSVENLVIRGNRIFRNDLHKPFFPDAPIIKLDYCRNVTIEDNHYTGKPKAFVQSNIPVVKYKKNKGFQSSVIEENK
ncbi:MAG: right-handed parallel beta-helix repeat-containing protein [Bacteroidales bacterium]|nr:right-handed parallel beta-helix repeat-containing protein [Bacteroidales bacterium]